MVMVMVELVMVVLEWVVELVEVEWMVMVVLVPPSLTDRSAGWGWRLFCWYGGYDGLCKHPPRLGGNDKNQVPYPPHQLLL